MNWANLPTAMMIVLVSAGCRDQAMSHDLVVGCWKGGGLEITIDKEGVLRTGDLALRTQGIVDDNHHFSIGSEPFRLVGSRINAGRHGFQDAWIQVQGDSRRVDTIRLIDTAANASSPLHRC